MEGALRGEKQLFDRAIPTPSGEIRYSQASYIPDRADDASYVPGSSKYVHPDDRALVELSDAQIYSINAVGSSLGGASRRSCAHCLRKLGRAG
jgi:hypothetical protein